MESTASLDHEDQSDGANLLDTTGLCLLSLDGGGVRGLSTLFILKTIMDRLNNERNKDGLPSVKPCEVFDLIGGTSTGGLIAIMLGRLEMSVDDCIKAYTDLAAAVFGEKQSRFPFSKTLNVKSRFDSAKLEKAIKNVVSGSGASAEEKFASETESKCKTFVCAVDLHTKDIVRLRSYSLAHESNIPATICQAGLATSAASTFFDPVNIGNRSFADGGLGANNPVDEVESEAATIWCSENADLKPLVKCFISIGTGNPGKKQFEDKMHRFLTKTVVQIATDTETVGKRFMDRWAKHFDEKRYFRFNVEQGLQNVGLHEYKKQGDIEAVSESYLGYREHKLRVRDCIQNLKLKCSPATPNFCSMITEKKLPLRIHSLECSLVGHQNNTSSIQVASRTQGLWVCPFQRNRYFVGRVTEINQVDHKITTQDRCERVAIYGLGGVGKTQIALEYAHLWKEKHPDGSVFWIPVTDVARMQDAYLEVGQQLQIPNIDQEKADVSKLVQQQLSQESTGKWLLVFDNADDIGIWTEEHEPSTGTTRRIDQLPKSKHGSILITTRSLKAGTKLAGKNVVPVKEMDGSMAKDLLKGSLINPDLLLDDGAATDLVHKLTYLPLAIVQAAAYINENDITLAQYSQLLEDVEQNVIDLLSEDFEDEGRYRDIRNPVATTFITSFEQIRTRDSVAADYLSFMACIEAKDIPQSLLPPAESEKRATDAIGTLSAYSFIKKHGTGQLLDLHRLVHLATRNWQRRYGSLDDWISKAMDRLSEVIPHTSEIEFKNRHVWAMYMPHVQRVIEFQRVSATTPVNIPLLWGYRKCLEVDFRDEERRISEQLFKAQIDMYGLENQDTLTALFNLGISYAREKKWARSEKIHVQALELRTKRLGEDHPNTLSSMDELIRVYTEQGRLDEAEQLSLQTLDRSKQVLGTEHSHTLKSMHRLTWTYKDQERLEEARRLGEETLETRKKVHGAEHPDTLESIRVLSEIYKEQGELDKAICLVQEMLEIRTRTLGADYPDTVRCVNELSRIYKRQGRLQEAEQLGLQALEKTKRALGPGHYQTANYSLDLGIVYFEQENWNKAEELLNQGLEIYKKIHGVEYPNPLICMDWLSMTWRKQGRYTEAVELLKECLEISSRVRSVRISDREARAAKLERWCQIEAVVNRRAQKPRGYMHMTHI